MVASETRGRELESLRTFTDTQLVATAKKYGTPFFLYDVDVVRERISALHRAFNGRFQIAMSLKANPNPNLIRKFLADVQWFDVASLGEFLLATIAGVPADRIVFIGPGKTVTELETAVSSSIGLLVVESMQEICHVDRISRTFGKRTNVLLRVNPDFRQASAGMQMGGVSSQFGIGIDELQLAVNLIKTLDHMCFKGIHVYLGSQILNVTALAKNFENIMSLAYVVQDLYGQPLSVIDFGGGFGVPYFPHEMRLDMAALQSEIFELLARHGRMVEHKCTFLIESGRFLFADAGVYVSSILYRKHSHGIPYAILDGGSNFHSSLSGLGKIVRGNFPMYSIGAGDPDLPISQEHSSNVHVVGPLCTPLDTLARNVSLEHDCPGDLVVFEKAGAYGLTFSQERFLSHTSISEFLCEHGRVELIKRRKSMSDLAHEYNVEEVTTSETQ